MTDIAVRAVGLGKMYRIGGERVGYRTLRDTLVQTAMRPIERIRHPGAATHASEILWALRNVDLEVKHGEVLGIIGRNGSGKSTLLKVVSHITEPTEGRAEIRGRVASLLEVGTGFHGELTGRENIQLNGAILGMRRGEIRSKFDEIVAFSGVEKFLDTPVKRYSSGMYVRLAFAVAAHLEPEILVVDEVLAVGDAEFQKKCLSRMSDVAKSGRTVLFVSHNMAAIQGLCGTAVLLDRGRVVEHGTVGSVISRYLADRATEGEVSGGVLATSKNGAVQLEAVRVTDAAGTPLAAVQCGGEAQIEIVIRSSVEMPYVVMALGINDSYGKRVTVLHTRISGFIPPLWRGLQSFLCRIDKVPLSPGPYLLEIDIYGGSHPPGERLIWGQDCGTLDVIDGDFYGTGQMPARAWGGVVQLTQAWSHRK